jgi:hypothetical protein
MNQNMNEMREHIFCEYRERLQKRKELDSKYEDLVNQIRAVEIQRNDAAFEVHRLKELIDIMITEDCDPVMAKLRYSEGVSAKAEKEHVLDISYSTTYAGGMKSTGAIGASNQSIFKRVMGAINGSS